MACWEADVKPLKLVLALLVASMLTIVANPASAQSFLDNLRKSFNELSDPDKQNSEKQTQSTAKTDPPKLFQDLKRAFSDLGARQASISAGVPRKFARKRVTYQTNEVPGTIIIDPKSHYLYFIVGDGEAIRYGVGVGRDGFGWGGTVRIGRKAEWPGWTPPPEMIARERARGIILPAHMEGGIKNPLGARALYLYRGGQDTIYRIHGSNEPWTIGQNVSSGCFRMTNTDIIDLYKRARVGAKVVVR